MNPVLEHAVIAMLRDVGGPSLRANFAACSSLSVLAETDGAAELLAAGVDTIVQRIIGSLERGVDGKKGSLYNRDLLGASIDVISTMAENGVLTDQPVLEPLFQWLVEQWLQVSDADADGANAQGGDGGGGSSGGGGGNSEAYVIFAECLSLLMKPMGVRAEPHAKLLYAQCMEKLEASDDLCEDNHTNIVVESLDLLNALVEGIGEMVCHCLIRFFFVHTSPQLWNIIHCAPSVFDLTCVCNSSC